METRSSSPELLAGGVRITDAEWPGVVATLDDHHRVAVNGKGSRYFLQTLCVADGKSLWAGTMYGSRTSLLKAASKVSDHAPSALSGLPEKPRDCMAEFQAAAQARFDAFDLTDWRRSDYLWTLQTWHHVESYSFAGRSHSYDWLRLVVTPGRHSLMLQIAFMGGEWSPLLWAETPAQLAALLRVDPVPMARGAASLVENCPDLSEAWGRALAQGSVLAALHALPDHLDQLDLPELPERPALRSDGLKRSVRRSAASGRKGQGRDGQSPKASRRRAGGKL